MDSLAEQCNYADYMAKYVTYPPTGLLPLPGTSVEFDEGCDVWDMIFNASVIVNPAFNPYRIFDVVSKRASCMATAGRLMTSLTQWPILWDVLGDP